MTGEHVCLSLILARKLRDELLDFLSEPPGQPSGFTVSDAAGHGTGVRLLSAAERVKGHADQVQVQIVLPVADATQLVDRLRVAFAGCNLVYWIAPVVEFGTIA